MSGPRGLGDPRSCRALRRRGACALLAAGLSTLLSTGHVSGQADSTMAQEGLYERPFIGGVSSTSIGGYLEGNTNYFVEDGVSEGFSMELRRFNIFLFSQVSQRVRFLAELEFEHGTEEIALETALIDLRVRPSLVLRGGILLPPLGFVNQNHDGPRWDFVERPLVATEIIPSTLSEAGFGAYGRLAARGLILSYDVYLTNGLGDGVLGNDLGRTDIASGKDEDLLGTDNNGSPAVSARLALRDPSIGEVGVSYYGGHYNSFRRDGVEVDERRWLRVAALDLGGSIGAWELRAELAHAAIDVPPGLSELFGDRQWGGHVDVLRPVWRPRIDGYPEAVVSAGARLEAIDYNVGTFQSTGESIRDDIVAVVPTLAFRPTPGTVFRANYRYQWIRDFPGNDPARLAGIQFGFATYF
jgi:hypothetical protein